MIPNCEGILPCATKVNSFSPRHQSIDHTKLLENAQGADSSEESKEAKDGAANEWAHEEGEKHKQIAVAKQQKY